MSDRSAVSLPEAASLDWLRKQAKRRLLELREKDPSAKLADAQFAIARQYGFGSWRALKAHVDSLSVKGRLFAAAEEGDLATLTALLEESPELSHAREEPYGVTLLHAAARAARSRSSSCYCSAASTSMRATRGTTPRRCTGPPARGTPRSCACWPMQEVMSSERATIMSFR